MVDCLLICLFVGWLFDVFVGLGGCFVFCFVFMSLGFCLIVWFGVTGGWVWFLFVWWVCEWVGWLLLGFGWVLCYGHCGVCMHICPVITLKIGWVVGVGLCCVLLVLILVCLVFVCFGGLLFMV